MKVDDVLVKNVAKTARLALTQKEVKEMVTSFQDVLNAFSVIQEADTEGVEPSVRPVSVKDIVREDIPEKALTQEETLSQTSHKKDGYFTGPKAV